MISDPDRNKSEVKFQSGDTKTQSEKGSAGLVRDGCPYAPMACELESFRFCRAVFGYSVVESTNTLARLLSETGQILRGTLVVADRQSAGRGRSDHSWYSPKGQGIYASLLLEPLVEPQLAHFVTLAAGLAVYRGLAGQIPDQSRDLDIKWPNDILWKGKKVSGILVESVVQDATLKHLVLGIGINVGQSVFPDDIQGRAVSLFQIAGRPFSRHDVLLAVLAQLDTALGLLAAGQSDRICREWESVSSFAQGRKVKFFEQGRPILGTTAGLQPDGALRVRTRHGERRAVYGGEIFEY